MKKIQIDLSYKYDVVNKWINKLFYWLIKQIILMLSLFKVFIIIVWSSAHRQFGQQREFKQTTASTYCHPKLIPWPPRIDTVTPLKMVSAIRLNTHDENLKEV